MKYIATWSEVSNFPPSDFSSSVLDITVFSPTFFGEILQMGVNMSFMSGIALHGFCELLSVALVASI